MMSKDFINELKNKVEKMSPKEALAIHEEARNLPQPVFVRVDKCLLCSGVLEDNSNTNVCDSCFINKWADGYDFGLDEEAEK